MNLEDLRSAQTRERATDGLQDLRNSFYADVADYIQDLKDQRDAAAAAADDPFGDPEVQELTDRIETAEQVAEAIYERRMGKLVKQASLAAAGMPDDAEGLTDEERALYGDLVDRIEANKAHVLDVISGDAEPTAGGAAESGTDASSTAVPDSQSDESTGEPGADSPAAAAMGGDLDADESAGGSSGDAEAPTEREPDGPSDSGAAEQNASGGEAEASVPDAVADDLARVQSDDSQDDEGSERDDADDGDVDRTTVRVTDDVGEIFGMDEREYTLEADDVVTLPAENARPLLEKDAAEKLD